MAILTLKVPITTAADDIHKYFFYCFPEKIRLDISWQSSHMKHQALFSSKDKSKKIKVSSAAIFVGHLRVKILFSAELSMKEVNSPEPVGI